MLRNLIAGDFPHIERFTLTSKSVDGIEPPFTELAYANTTAIASL